MADDRFCYIHSQYNLYSLLPKDSSTLQDEGQQVEQVEQVDDMLDWELPDDDISVPNHLLPPFQDEDDETLLPSQTHPSYPYGNPYRLHSSLSTSTSLYPSSSNPSSSSSSSTKHFSSSTFPSNSTLSTNLSTLELPYLYSQTFLGDLNQRLWSEQGLIGLFGPKTIKEFKQDEEEFEIFLNTHGDAGPPAGQNAADGAEDDEDEEDEDEDDGQDEQGSQVGEGGGEITGN
ncbi:hypothetical protein JCM3765_002253 [Sporobolomyces pararoseus]